MESYVSTPICDSFTRYGRRRKTPSIVFPAPAGLSAGLFRLTWASILSAILFRINGASIVNPTRSVTNPGVSRRAPATANSKPSTTSIAGTWPCSRRLRPLVKVRKPSRRSIATPTTAVITTNKTVDEAPIWPPTSIRMYISTSGVRKKTSVHLPIHDNLGTK